MQITRLFCIIITFLVHSVNKKTGHLQCAKITIGLFGEMMYNTTHNETVFHNFIIAGCVARVRGKWRRKPYVRGRQRKFYRVVCWPGDRAGVAVQIGRSIFMGI